MPKPFETLFKPEDFVPALLHEFEQQAFDLSKVILVAIPIKDPSTHPTPVPSGRDRRELAFIVGDKSCAWQAESLRSLFRGDKQPPALGAYPEAYNDSFCLLDLHALEISQIFGDRRDTEMKEIYSALRRRPDGRSLGFAHDYMWQAAAFVLATRPLSQAEFEAIMARLERSCATFEMGPTSKNYIAALRTTFGQPQRPSR